MYVLNDSLEKDSQLTIRRRHRFRDILGTCLKMLICRVKMYIYLKFRVLFPNNPCPVTRIDNSNPPLPLLADRSVDVLIS